MADDKQEGRGFSLVSINVGQYIYRPVDFFFFNLLAKPQQRYKSRFWVNKKLFIFIKFSTNLIEI